MIFDLFLQRFDERDFGVQKEINKRKKLLMEGKVGICVVGKWLIKQFFIYISLSGMEFYVNICIIIIDL